MLRRRLRRDDFLMKKQSLDRRDYITHISSAEKSKILRKSILRYFTIVNNIT